MRLHLTAARAFRSAPRENSSILFAPYLALRRRQVRRGVSFMNFPLRAAVAICCGVLLIFAEWKVCPVSLEAVIYWSLPLFHTFFHPLESGPSPQAALCSLILNSVLVTVGVFWFLSRGNNEHDHTAAGKS